MSLFSEGFSKNRIGKSRKQTTCDQITQRFLRTAFTNELNEDSKLENLRTDMQMNALEKKWEFVVMAGEMNKWIEEAVTKEDDQTMTGLQFLIISQETNFVIIRKEGQMEELMPEVVFVKRYKAMKKQQGGKKVTNKNISRTAHKNAEPQSGKGQPGHFSQRDRELNQALLHIMRVRNTLEYQYRILSENAINT